MSSMRKIIALLAAVSFIMSGCENSPRNLSGEVSGSDSPEQVTSLAAVPAPAAVSAPAAANTQPAKTVTSGKKIKPLTASSKNGYYEDEDFSVTVKLSALQSSLYYPDIVAEMGANPKLFVVTVFLKVRNMTYEDKSFDCSRLSLTDGTSEFFLYSPDFENMKNIPSGKTENAELRFLCTLEQASEIKGMSCDGVELKTGSYFIPEEFDDIIEKQSAEDVMEYLYHPYVAARSKGSGYHTIRATPTSYEMHHISGFREGDKKYISVTYTAYNRSDYAQLIEPGAFSIVCSNGKGTATERAKPLYISADEKYIYSPKEADVSFKGTGQLYEIPDFICTDPDGTTDFTIIYDAGEKTQMNFFSFVGTHPDEPYYSEVQVILGFELDLWEEE